MGDVLEHVIEPVKVLKKVKQMLKKDGILWISTWHGRGRGGGILLHPAGQAAGRQGPVWLLCLLLLGSWGAVHPAEHHGLELCAHSFPDVR